MTKLKILAICSALLVLGLGGIAKADTANSTISVGVNAVISLSSSGTVTVGALSPDATGKQSIASDTVSVDTNNSLGYTLTLKDADTTYTLTSGSDTFAATSGTYASPSTLANGEWGWRVDSLGSFGAGPTNTLSNGSPSSLTFAAIPANGSPQTINSSSSPGSASTSVWYSARANTSQPTGTYTDTVTYTATAN